jgi:hypothetical protein
MTTRERNKINDAVRALSQEEDVAMISDAASRISKPFNPDQSNLTSSQKRKNGHGTAQLDKSALLKASSANERQFMSYRVIGESNSNGNEWKQPILMAI